MTEALFQHIPRCLFEPFAVAGIVGLCFFLYGHWQKNKAETILFGGAVFFMVLWRVLMPINADRYALILIPVAVFTTVLAHEKIVFFFRRFLPSCALPLCLCALLVACIIKSFCGNSEDRYLFAMIETLKQEAKDRNQEIQVFSDRDISVFLEDNFKVNNFHLQGKTNLSDFPPGDYYLLKLNRKRQHVEADTSEISEVRRIAPENGKFEFVLWKKERRDK